MRSALFWLIGIPIPLILLVAFCTGHLWSPVAGTFCRQRKGPPHQQWDGPIFLSGPGSSREWIAWRRSGWPDGHPPSALWHLSTKSGFAAQIL